MSHFKSMELKKISILEWLENYNLEDFHYLIFLDTFGNTKHSDLLTNIKTNIDLLFSFNKIDDFLESITIPVQKKLSEKYNPELIIKKQDTVLKQFSRAFELLQYQKKEYKAMLSVFGIDPSKEKYNRIMSHELRFLDTKKYKDISKKSIIGKLKVLNFNELLEGNQTTFNLLLSIPIDEIKKYMEFTSIINYKIVHGIKSSFTKERFDTFIDTNQNLKDFVSDLDQINNYDLTYIINQLKLNFDAKSLLYSHYTDLVVYFFNPKVRLDSEITDKIYTTLFPDNDHKYIDEQFSRIPDNIPETIITNTFMKKNKMRVFLIIGHGSTTSISDYTKKKRVDFEKMFLNIRNKQGRMNRIKYNTDNLQIITTQPVGRFAIPVINVFNKIFGYKHRNVFLQGLLNATNPEHLQLLNKLVTIYWNYYFIKNTWSKIYPSTELLPPYQKKSRLKSYQDMLVSSGWVTKKMFKYPEQETTTSDIVNFVKYGVKYPPINTQFNFTPNHNEQLLGIFELNENNAHDLIDLNNKIKSTIDGEVPDSNLKLGLKLNEVYGIDETIPETAEEILKYNMALKPKISKIYTLEELIELIYLEGDITDDEHVVIFDNACRGLSSSIRDSRLAERTYNSHSSLSHEEQSILKILRSKSMEKSLNSVVKTRNSKKKGESKVKKAKKSKKAKK
jgi:hypothetical protein